MLPHREGQLVASVGAGRAVGADSSVAAKVQVPPARWGAKAPVDERAVITAVVYVLTSGCAWRCLPGPFEVSSATTHRRFTLWTEAGLWHSSHRAVLGKLGVRGPDRSSAIVDAASVRAKGSPLRAFLGLAATLACYMRLAKLPL
ncbi:transposase [Streptomyces sp. NPDC102283]|uniref:transposase n=1 Tax=Streptomyces sp. NPDC102283 TaxID=3366155 RepID=UPI00382C3241